MNKRSGFTIFGLVAVIFLLGLVSYLSYRYFSGKNRTDGDNSIISNPTDSSGKTDKIDKSKALKWLDSFYKEYIAVTGSDTTIYDIVDKRNSSLDESVAFVKKNSTPEYFTEFSKEIYATNRSGHGEDVLMCTLYSPISSHEVISSELEGDGLDVLVKLYGERGQNDSPMENNIKLVFESDVFKIKSSYCPMSRS